MGEDDDVEERGDVYVNVRQCHHEVEKVADDEKKKTLVKGCGPETSGGHIFILEWTVKLQFSLQGKDVITLEVWIFSIISCWPHERREEDSDGGDVAQDAQAAEDRQAQVTDTEPLRFL